MKSKSHSRIIALFLAVITVFASAIPAMAAESSTGSKGTDIAVLDDSSYTVAGKDTKQSAKSEYELFTHNGNDIISSVNVYATVADGSNVYDPENPDADEDGFVNGKIQVGVPTTIIIDGKPNSEGYYVGEAFGKVKGNISGSTVISVVPDDEVTLSSEGKNDVTAPIEQDYTQFVVSTSEYSGDKVNKNVTPSFNDKAVFDVDVKTKGLSAGSWSGSFNYNISVLNTTVAALGNRVTSWNISATDSDDVWMSYYQANSKKMSTLNTTKGTSVEKFEDGTVVISGTGNMEESVNKHFFDLDSMNTKLTSLIWDYLRENLTDDEYALVTSRIDEDADTWYYSSAYSLDHHNLNGLPSEILTFINDAMNAARTKIYPSQYIKYIPKKVIIMDGVTNVSKGAFNGCSKLEEVDLGNTIKEIGSHSFMNCSSLSELIIPDSCEVIGNLFADTSKVKSVHLPASVREITESPTFLNKTVTIDESSPYFFIQDGVIYSKDGKTLIGLTKESPADLVEVIKDLAFQKKMNTLTLPASLQEMGVNVFMSHSDLEVICKSQKAYDIMQNLIKVKANTKVAFKGTVTLAID